MRVLIDKKDIGFFFESLKEENTVYGVKQKEPGFYVFDEAETFSDPLDKYTPTLLSPKKYLFPQKETLLKFSTTPSLKVKQLIEFKKQVIFGVRPCDIHGIKLLDKVFTTDHEDKNYTQKRANTIIIGIDCMKPCYKYAYCESVGCLDVEDGFDVLLTDMGDCFYALIGTAQGEAIIRKNARFINANKSDDEKIKCMKEERRGLFENKFATDISNLPLLFKNADNDPVWDELNDRCLGCGRCNIVCPTCYCFDVFDCVDLNMSSGERCRQWDACTLKDFAVVATGENFRSTRGQRLRHRFNRKFNYLMTKHNTSFCVGCGRCSRSCPVKIDVVETVNAVVNNRKTK